MRAFSVSLWFHLVFVFSQSFVSFFPILPFRKRHSYWICWRQIFTGLKSLASQARHSINLVGRAHLPAKNTRHHTQHYVIPTVVQTLIFRHQLPLRLCLLMFFYLLSLSQCFVLFSSSSIFFYKPQTVRSATPHEFTPLLGCTLLHTRLLRSLTRLAVVATHSVYLIFVILSVLCNLYHALKTILISNTTATCSAYHAYRTSFCRHIMSI